MTKSASVNDSRSYGSSHCWERESQPGNRFENYLQDSLLISSKISSLLVEDLTSRSVGQAISPAEPRGQSSFGYSEWECGWVMESEEKKGKESSVKKMRIPFPFFFAPVTSKE